MTHKYLFFITLGILLTNLNCSHAFPYKEATEQQEFDDPEETVIFGDIPEDIFEYEDDE